MSDQLWIEALSLRSSAREKILEHRFLAEVASEMWSRGIFDLGVATGQVDDSGYDVILEVGPVTRHVQLKARHSGGRAARYSIQSVLAQRPSACVVVIVHHPRTLAIDHYRFFGGEPGCPIPDLGDKPVLHTKGDAKGKKAIRPALRSVALARFDTVSDVAGLCDRLFGDAAEVHEGTI